MMAQSIAPTADTTALILYGIFGAAGLAGMITAFVSLRKSKNENASILVTAAEKVVNLQDSAIRDLRLRVDQLETQAREVETLRRRISELEIELAEIRAENDRLRTQRDRLEKEVKSLKSRIQLLESHEESK